eukprot:gnl/MRDRNA2_/MRDRNA2_114042_c0_seq1.p1 gnl/MRDRNA2_/MRDRNA2_114042_c0~~gnl/MRDRNA2_/MRDRNA2_114042_c0_seq1.p1  ORF type:complete len:255 (+),score=57.40 gnl/MRDRNA2_/MRDRNA2_114042_c0_seq1:56-820(+)
MARMFRSIPMFTTAILLSLHAGSAIDPVVLNKDDFNEIIDVSDEDGNFGAIVKYQKLETDYKWMNAMSKMVEYFYESPNFLMGTVWCGSSANEPLCQEHGVTTEMLPVLKYFSHKTGPKGEFYTAGDEYSHMRKFAKKTLKAKLMACNVVTLADCEDSQLETIHEWREKPVEEIEEKMLELEAELREHRQQMHLRLHHAEHREQHMTASIKDDHMKRTKERFMDGWEKRHVPLDLAVLKALATGLRYGWHKAEL